MLKLDLNPPLKELRLFAWASLVMLPVLAAMFTGWQWLSLPVVISAGIGLTQFVLMQISIKVLTHLLWVVLAPPSFLIGMVLSHVLLAVIFWGVMTLIGLVFRLIGRDAMHRRFDRSATSYWTERGAARSPATYFRLY